MQRPVVWLGALLLVGCSEKSVDITAPRKTPTAANHDVVVTDPSPANGAFLSSSVFGAQIAVGTALFGPQVIASPGYVLDGEVVRTPAGTSSTDVVNEDGCTPFDAPNIAGNIVLIDRGGCTFATKVRNADDAGAIAVIIRDNVVTTFPPKMAADGVNTVDIPAVSVTKANGTTLKNAIAQTGSVHVQVLITPVDQPTVHLPDDITTNATSAAGAVVSYRVFGTAYRDLGSVGCSVPSGRTFPVGTTTVTCSTVDLWNNTASGSFTVTVKPLDTTPPTISVGPNITAELTNPSGASVAYPQPTAIDDDGQSVAVTCNPPAGPFPLGTTTVTCTATDAAGNTASASFVVTVLDTTAPALSLPPNVVTDATSTAGALVSYVVTAMDLSGTATVTCSPASGSTFPIGTTSVACQARDASGNVAAGAFSVTVKAASAQIVDLQQAVAGLDLQEGTETSVQAKLSAALDALNARNVVDACGSLGALINQINAQAGKKISFGDAQALIATVQRIRSAAGC